MHVVDVGGIQAPKLLMSYFTNGSQTIVDKESVNKIAASFNGVTFKDGTYTGEATGYRPGLQVSVIVSDNKITDIKVTSHNEVNSRFYQRPIDTIPKEIINSQSLDVDTVSGATRTSVGIINAVNNALSKSVVSGSLPQTDTLPSGDAGGGPGGHKGDSGPANGIYPSNGVKGKRLEK